MNAHQPSRDLLNLAIDNGWNAAYVYRKDVSEGAPYITVEARLDDERNRSHRVIVTWHTRGTGTYRLFSCMADLRDMSLKRARMFIAERVRS